MSETADFHLEALAERVRQGIATAEERAQLEWHVDRCSACSFERELARQAEPQPGDEEHHARLAQATVARLLSHGSASDHGERGLHLHGTEPEARKRRRIGVLAAAAVLVFVSGIGSAFAFPWMFDGLVGTQSRRTGPQGAKSQRAKSTPAKSTPVTRRAPVSSRQEHIAPQEPPVHHESLEEPVAPSHQESRVQGRRGGRRDKILNTPARLLERAAQARRNGRIRSATRLYRQLLRRFPSAPEGAVARVSLGRLLLDQSHQPRQALRAFDGYLSRHRGGALEKEALIGRATALRRIGRTQDELRTWSTLVARYPSTLYAKRARSRMAEIQQAAREPVH